jgi:glutathione peroxidase
MTVIDHAVETLDLQATTLAAYRGKALLIVNTASACGYTPQYKPLQALHARYEGRGFAVLGFPCNDFGAQEPGTEAEIHTFCETHFGVTFPMFAKVHAKGPHKHPLYKALTEETGEGIKGEVKWNFTKFLVSPTGEVLRRFEPSVDPLSAEVTAAVEAALPGA